jgi:hypothetical protein
VLTSSTSLQHASHDDDDDEREAHASDREPEWKNPIYTRCSSTSSYASLGPDQKAEEWCHINEKDIEIIGEKGKYGPKPIGSGSFAQVFKAMHRDDSDAIIHYAKKELLETIFEVRVIHPLTLAMTPPLSQLSL